MSKDMSAMGDLTGSLKQQWLLVSGGEGRSLLNLTTGVKIEPKRGYELAVSQLVFSEKGKESVWVDMAFKDVLEVFRANGLVLEAK